MKTCTQCKQVKPLADFYKNSQGKGSRYGRCKACHAEHTERWRKDPKNKKVKRHIAWKGSLKYKYGITEDGYKKLLEWSQGGCAICGERPGLEHRGKKKLAVDHSHSTGKVRGLLCTNCNLGLGKFKDDRKLLRIAIAYLDYFEPEKHD